MTAKPTKKTFRIFITIIALIFCVGMAAPARAEMIDFPVIKLRSLDKITARTMTFEARVGSTVKFGPLYIKIQACRKTPPIDQPESAAFLQIWEVTSQSESKWVFSGWMFASSPSLSSMDHPVYDVWVIDCLERKSTDPVPPPAPATAPSPGRDLLEENEGKAPDPGTGVTAVTAPPPAATATATAPVPTITAPAPEPEPAHPSESQTELPAINDTEAPQD